MSSSPETNAGIDSIMVEDRVFFPPESLSRDAHVKSLDEYQRLYKKSIEDPEQFWGDVASQLDWIQKWSKVLDWNPPYAKWFVGGKLNAASNCLDRQIALGRADKTAIIWEGETVEGELSAGEVRKITYAQLNEQVNRFANGLRDLGIAKGDCVTIYMPLVPEAVVAILACARIGAPHSVIFGGFSSQAILDRIEDAKSNWIITADAGRRRGQIVPLKANVDEAVAKTQRIKKVIVLKHAGNDVSMQEGRDLWWSDVVADQSTQCPAEAMDAEDLLFVLYTSGSTGKPKGIMHSTAGYLVGSYITTKYIFDLHEQDIYWCTADVGWITGHSYVVYGPLSNGATVFMYEGAPTFPDFGRFWSMIQRHKITILYTAPTAIRAFMSAGREIPDKYDMTSLRVLGTVGEPINPEAWMWYQQVIGGGRCPIVDTWWQTETGAIMISPLPGAIPTKPGTASLPFFGIEPAVVDHEGNDLPPNKGGLLVIRRPWPAMLRGILNDPDRYIRQYWTEVKGCYFTGDGARRDNDGYFWLMGRVDDVINVAGHRLGTAEIESALVAHDAVTEAAVVPIPHKIKGTGIAAFVTLEIGRKPSEELKIELTNWVAKQIGAIAKPDHIRFADSLPKTRSGKIMRRLLKELAANGKVSGDVTTLEDLNVLAKLKQQED